ncbi:MAG: hypothetical protein HDT41_03205, partial [Lachnospiraceae bacterium]|nr:hypothetical protein [Lachnospiraceae bacterium]
IKALTDVRLFERIVVVCMEEQRALPLEQLKESFLSCREVGISFFPTVEEGMVHAFSEKNKEDIVFVAGSLYLVGDVKSLLRKLPDIKSGKSRRK